MRAMIGLIVILILAAASKFVLPPDDYYAGVLLRAALHFFDPEIFKVEVVLLLLAALTAYGAIFAAISMSSPKRAWIYSLGIVLVALSVYWLLFDHSVHASSRYYLRTVLVLLTPMFGAAAALSAMAGDGITFRPLATTAAHPDLSQQPGDLRIRRGICGRDGDPCGRNRKVRHGMDRLPRPQIAALATGHEADPALGNPQFVSSERISPKLDALSWFSTIPYLSVVLANFSPTRLVIDPAGNYFWLSCATATRNRDAERAVPVQPRELVRIYSCLHR